MLERLKNYLKNDFSSQKDSKYLCVLLIVLTAVIFYFRNLFFGYTFLDDLYLIASKNNDLKNLSFLSAFANDFFYVGDQISNSFYRPLAVIPWMIAARIVGAKLWLYHLENILFHALAVSSFFVLLLKLGYSNKKSLLASLLLLLHPIGASICGFVPNLSYAMLLFFTCVAFIFGIDYQDKNKSKYLIAHFIFFTAALFTLETAIGFIPLVVYYLAVVKKQKNTKILSFGLIYLLILSLWFYLRSGVIISVLKHIEPRVILTNLSVIFAMFKYLLLPFTVKPLAVAGFTFGDTAIGFIAFILFVFAAFTGKIKNKQMFLCGMLFALMFLIPSFLSAYQFNLMPHRFYISFAGILIMLLEIDFSNILSEKVKRILFCAFFALAAVFGLRFGTYYSGAEVFWEKVTHDNPSNAMAREGLLDIYSHMKKYSKLVEKSREFLNKNPGNIKTRKRYINGLIANKEYETAGKEIQNLLSIYNDSESHTIYAEYFKRLKNEKSAAEEYKKAIQLDNNSDTAHYSYGTFLYETKKYPEALKEFKIALKKNTNLFSSLNLDGRINIMIALALYQMGNSKEAETAARKAVDIQANRVNRQNLSFILLDIAGKTLNCKNDTVCKNRIEEAVKIYPIESTVRNAARVFYKKGMPQESLDMAKQAYSSRKNFNNAINVAAICIKMEDEECALEYLKKSLSYGRNKEEVTKVIEQIVLSLNN